MSLEKQIKSTAKAMNHAKFWSQEHTILLNQYEIMLALVEINSKLSKCDTQLSGETGPE